MISKWIFIRSVIYFYIFGQGNATVTTTGALNIATDLYLGADADNITIEYGTYPIEIISAGDIPNVATESSRGTVSLLDTEASSDPTTPTDTLNNAVDSSNVPTDTNEIEVETSGDIGDTDEGHTVTQSTTLVDFVNDITDTANETYISTQNKVNQESKPYLTTKSTAVTEVEPDILDNTVEVQSTSGTYISTQSKSNSESMPYIPKKSTASSIVETDTLDVTKESIVKTTAKRPAEYDPGGGTESDPDYHTEPEVTPKPKHDPQEETKKDQDKEENGEEDEYYSALRGIVAMLSIICTVLLVLVIYMVYRSKRRKIFEFAATRNRENVQDIVPEGISFALQDGPLPKCTLSNEKQSSESNVEACPDETTSGAASSIESMELSTPIDKKGTSAAGIQTVTIERHSVNNAFVPASTEPRSACLELQTSVNDQESIVIQDKITPPASSTFNEDNEEPVSDQQTSSLESLSENCEKEFETISKKQNTTTVQEQATPLATQSINKTNEGQTSDNPTSSLESLSDDG